MRNFRFFAALAFFMGFTWERLAAELTAGGSAITTASTSIIANGKPVGTLEAGQSVAVLGVQTATKQAVVSYQTASGSKLVGLVPLENLIAVDSSAQPGNTGTAPFVPSAPAPAATPAPVKLELSQLHEATDVAQLFKTDKVSAKAQCEGQRVKFKGIIDKVDLDTSSSGGDMPILVLKTASGLPRLKVKLSNSLATNDVFFRRYNSSIPDWWWGYGGNRAIDYRLSEMKEIQVRAIYRYNHTTRWSDGTSTVSRSRSNSPWFTIFKIGEPVSVEGTCKGLYMDVEFENGNILADSNY